MSLDLKYITFGFDTGKLLLNNINLKLEQGLIYVLMGSNGAGKTTLFNLISGFIKPGSGKISFNNQDITNWQPHQINSKAGIARTFQTLRLITLLTVKENIILAMKDSRPDVWLYNFLPRKFSLKMRQKQQQQGVRIAKEFFLTDVMDCLVSDISYGQQKLLSLACCVANGASLLLLDEVAAGIQPLYLEKIRDILLKLKADGKTIFIIEHNTTFIDQISDHIFFLNKKGISGFKSLTELRGNKEVMESYM